MIFCSQFLAIGEGKKSEKKQEKICKLQHMACISLVSYLDITRKSARRYLSEIHMKRI